MLSGFSAPTPWLPAWEVLRQKCPHPIGCCSHRALLLRRLVAGHGAQWRKLTGPDTFKFSWVSVYWHISFYGTSIYWTLQILHFFINWRFVQTSIERVYQFHFSKSIYSFCVCHIFVILTNFFIIIIFIMAICEQWSLVLLLQLFWGTTNHTHIRQQT